MVALAVAILYPLYVAATEKQVDESENVEELVLQIEQIKLQLEELQRLAEASVTVPDKIIRLAESHSVDISTALNIACAESQFYALAQNPKSSAGGVYQWLDSSWAYYSMKYYGFVGDKMNEDENIELAILVMKDKGFSDWNESRWSGIGGGWEAKPYERGFCPDD